MTYTVELSEHHMPDRFNIWHWCVDQFEYNPKRWQYNDTLSWAYTFTDEKDYLWFILRWGR